MGVFWALSNECIGAAKFVVICQEMNSSNNVAILRSLIIYAICVPLAITVGYLLTNPMDYSTLGMLGILLLVLVSPLLLRWHYPLLFLSWNMNVSLFFLKGSPNLWLVMVTLCLGISLLLYLEFHLLFCHGAHQQARYCRAKKLGHCLSALPNETSGPSPWGDRRARFTEARLRLQSTMLNRKDNSSRQL